MVYFRCTSSGSGKGNTVIVTCAEQFAGVAITIAKIGKSYTKVCPLSAPYVVKFYGVEAGTYTVSATVSGQTYSAEVVVQDVSCVLNYGFTWKTWVDTASQLDSTDYASLSEVLADEKAVRELFLEHACVDYMADSTSSNADLETIIENDLCAKWINNSDYALDYLGANVVIKALMDTANKYGYGEWVNNNGTWGPKGNVPVMTANNAPYGEASATSVQSGSAVHYPFMDELDEHFWMASGANTGSGDALTYKFTNPVKCKKLKIKLRTNEAAAYNVTTKVQASNDGTNWSDVSESFTLSVATVSALTEVAINADNYYLYYKIVKVSSSVSLKFGITIAQFYGRSLSVSVPTMTSNTAPFGEASASSQASSSNAPFKAFDNDASTLWSGSSATLSWLAFKFNSKVCLKAFSRVGTTCIGSSAVDSKRIQYRIIHSNDGTTWNRDSDTWNDFTLSVSESQYDFALNDAENAYNYWGIEYRIKDGSNATFNTKSLQFYGLDYSEKEFETGTTKKWLYDHGVELESMEMPEYTGNSFVGSTIEKLSSSIKLNVGSNTYGGCGVITSDKINLNAFDLIRMKISEFGSTSSSSNVAISVVSNKTGANPTNIANASFTRGNSNIPYNMSLDISSVNEEDYVLAIVGNAPSFSAEMSELWLE